MVDERKIDIIKKGRPVSIFDIVIISLCLILSLSYVILSCVSRTESGQVKIYVKNGGEFYYDTAQNRQIGETELGLEKGEITIIIEDGWVYVKSSACHNQTCVHSGKIKYSGEFIACLPQGVFVQIIGKGLHLSVG